MASPARGGSASAGPYPPDAVEPLLLELRGMDEDSRLAAAGVGAAFAASFPSMPDEAFLSSLTAVQWSRVAAALQVPAGDILDIKDLPSSTATSEEMKHLAQTGDWMLQVDLTDGFHILGIHEMDVPKMAWQCGVTGETYLYQVLPFGYALSPYAFCTAMSVFTRVLRSPDVSSLDRGKPESLLHAIKQDLLAAGRQPGFTVGTSLLRMDDCLCGSRVLEPLVCHPFSVGISLYTLLSPSSLRTCPERCCSIVYYDC